MNRLSARYCIVGLFILSITWPLQGKQSRTPGSSNPTQPGGSVSGTPGRQPGATQPRWQAPVYVNGRILMNTGQPVPEPVSVRLDCGVRSIQVVQTDLKGYFQFALGAGPQNNMDFSASNDAPMSPAGNRMPSRNDEFSRSAGSGIRLTGCEVRVTVPGYQPLSKPIVDRTEISGVDIGTLYLTRIAGVAGSSISVTSLLVPNRAREEFEKGEKDVRSNHLKSAIQHLEKAVAEYKKYAAAWNALGNIYAANREAKKAGPAFEKAIAADPEYVPPYVSLAYLELQNKEFERAVETSGKALKLDPSVGVASFIQAVGNFNLNRLDAAEKDAQDAERGPHQSMPDLHALHATILMKKQDYSNAAVQIRAYLKEFPQGRFANQMKQYLKQIEASQPNADGESKSVESQTAP